MMTRMVRRAAAIGLAVGVTATVAFQPWIAEAQRSGSRSYRANGSTRYPAESRSNRLEAEESEEAAPATSRFSAFNPLTRIRTRFFGTKSDAPAETNSRTIRAVVDPFANDEETQSTSQRTSSAQTNARDSQRVRLLPKPGAVEARRAAVEAHALRQSAESNIEGERVMAREKAASPARRRAVAAPRVTREMEYDADFDAAIASASGDEEQRVSQNRPKARTATKPTGVARVGANSKQPKLNPEPVADDEITDESALVMEAEKPAATPARRPQRKIGRAHVGRPAKPADASMSIEAAPRTAKKGAKKPVMITPSSTESSSEQLVRRRADELMDRAQQAILARDTAAAIRLARIAEQLESAARSTYRPGQVRPSEFLKQLESQIRDNSVAHAMPSTSNSASQRSSRSSAIVAANNAARGPDYRELRSFHGGSEPSAVHSNQGVVLTSAAKEANTRSLIPESSDEETAETVSAVAASASGTSMNSKSTTSSSDEAGLSLEAPVVSAGSAAADPTAETETESKVANSGPVVIDTEAAAEEATAASGAWSIGRIVLACASCVGLLLGVAGLVGLNWFRRTRREQTPPPSDAAVEPTADLLKVIRHAA